MSHHFNSADSPDTRSQPQIATALRDRIRGALIGLAVGDAVGTTVEFQRPGTFTPVTDLVGGGPFDLEPGQWTDDTSMALSLAASLIDKCGFDAADQMERYVRWYRDGYLSSTGRCFDIGNTVRQALVHFEQTGEPFAGSTAENTAGNGSLMRLAPVSMLYHAHDELLRFAADSSRTTHAAPVAVDCCRYFAALTAGAICGHSRDILLANEYEHFRGCWDEAPLHPVVQGIADGSYRQKQPPAIRGTGYAADALEAALWAFHSSHDFREGCLLAVNLGEDADTTAAIYGQLAGAFYGESGIPTEWRERLAHKALIDGIADSLAKRSLSLPAKP